MTVEDVSAAERAAGGLSPKTVELDGPFSHDYVHLRGVRLHIVRAGAPAYPLVLLLHDTFGGWFDYRGVIAPLAARGLSVAAVDVRGYGMSDKPPAAHGNPMRTAVGDVTGLIRALGKDKAVLVGADSGGAIAWCAAAAAPGQVRGLVSVAAAHPTDLRRAALTRPWLHAAALLRAVVTRLPGASRGLPVRHTGQLHNTVLERWTAPPFRDSERFGPELRLRRRAARIASAGPGAMRHARMSSAAVPGGWAGHVAADTLLIAPETAAFADLNRRARRRVTGRLECAGLPGTARLPHVEAPEAFAGLVGDWIDRLDRLDRLR